MMVLSSIKHLHQGSRGYRATHISEIPLLAVVTLCDLSSDHYGASCLLLERTTDSLVTV